VCNHTAPGHDNRILNGDDVLKGIKDLVDLRDTNEAIENKLMIMDDQIKFWNDIKTFLENIVDDRARPYENSIVMQREAKVLSTENTAKIQFGEIIFGQPTVTSKALVLQNPFNKSVVLGAQMKFLFLINHPGINLILTEMNKIHSLRSFEDILQNVSKQVYVFDEDSYEYILKFSLAIIQKMVHTQNNAISTTVDNRKRRDPMAKLDQQFKIAIENQQKMDIVSFKCKICQYIGNSLLESRENQSIQQILSP
jgi:hypothetical protein